MTGSDEAAKRSPGDAGPSRAQWAWDNVSNKVEPHDTEYLSEARKLPARLFCSGLGQTVAFLYSKGAKKVRGSGTLTGRDLLYKHIDEWVWKENKHDQPMRTDQCMDIIVGLSAVQYRMMTRELLATAEWLKRFAEGHITVKKPNARGRK